MDRTWVGFYPSGTPTLNRVHSLEFHAWKERVSVSWKPVWSLDYDTASQRLSFSYCVSDADVSPESLSWGAGNLVLVLSYPNGFICPVLIPCALLGNFYPGIVAAHCQWHSNLIHLPLSSECQTHVSNYLLDISISSSMLSSTWLTCFLPTWLFSLVFCSLPVLPTCSLPSVSSCFYIVYTVMFFEFFPLIHFSCQCLRLVLHILLIIEWFHRVSIFPFAPQNLSFLLWNSIVLSLPRSLTLKACTHRPWLLWFLWGLTRGRPWQKMGA